MKALKKRIDDLEYKANTGEKAVIFLWADNCLDGGIVHEGKFYEDCEAMLCDLGITQREGVYIFGWPATDTAAELLERENRIRDKLKRLGKPWIPSFRSLPVQIMLKMA